MLRDIGEGTIDEEGNKYLCLKCAKTYDKLIDMNLLDQENQGICESCKHSMVRNEYWRINNKVKAEQSKKQPSQTTIIG